MDRLEFDLLKVLGFAAFAGPSHDPEALRPSHVARALGVAAKTVRERLDHLAGSGVFEGYAVEPNPRHLGFSRTAVYFRVAEDHEVAAMRAAREAEGVGARVAFLGGYVACDVFHEDEAQLRRREHALAVEMGGARTLSRFERHGPLVRRALTPLDWRIVRVLRQDASGRHPSSLLDAAASRLGVSARTVRRHYERMVAEGSILVAANLRPERVTTAIVAALLVAADGSTPLVLSRLGDALPGRVLHKGLSRDGGSLLVAALAASLSELAEARARLEDAARGGHVHVLCPCAWEPPGSWLDEAIARRAARAESEVSGSARAKGPT